MKNFVVCAIVFLVFGCTKESNPVYSNGQQGSFGIYFLKDSTLTAYKASQVGINQLELRDNPWLSDDGIEFYDFSSHCIYLKQDKSKYFESYTEFYRFAPMSRSRPFVVVANAERCYVGSLHSMLLSSLPTGPYMDEMDVGYYPADVLHISKAFTTETDIRSDSRVKAALNALGLYRGGIYVHLQSVNVVENSDTSTVEYVFTVVNLDRDNLFIPDPDKMGTDLFHYFTNGIVFQGDGVLFQSTYKETSSPSVKWDVAWFTELPASASTQRTVRLKGYPKVTPGIYSCSFAFASPVEIEKEGRSVFEGRIWLGEVVSDKIKIVVP
jgi:hypothetical protein